MKLRFYFDYSDYRSWLMLHTLSVLDDLPVQVQWIAVDAYSLRALTGCSSSFDCPPERNYMKQDAMRFCQREGIEFVWQNDRFHSGAALRLGIWLMTCRHDRFESYSRLVLKQMWGHGKNVDQADLKEMISQLGIDRDIFMKSSSEQESFQIQDSCLQQAMADGVFDVPALVIGDQIVCHYDQAAEIRRLAMLGLIQNMPHDTVCRELASLLHTLPHEQSTHFITEMFRRTGTRQTSMSSPGIDINLIQHSLSMPAMQRHIERSVMDFSACQIRVAAGNTLQNIFDQALDGCITICPSQKFERNDEMEMTFPESLDNALVIARIVDGSDSEFACFCLENGRIRRHFLHTQDIVIEHLKNLKIAILGSEASKDLHLARLAAFYGTHAAIVSGLVTPQCEAFASLSEEWCINLQSRQVQVTNAKARSIVLNVYESCFLDESQHEHSANAWNASAPRTLLLCENSLSIGELSDNADLELSCRGINLFAADAQQSSELSPSRIYEKFRMQSSTILLIPLQNEQIYIPELISLRLIETINQAPCEGYPLFINYWNELEFEMLDELRPVHAALAKQYCIPILFVVGSQVVEIWLPSPNGPAWRVEKENDSFCIDLNDLTPIGECFASLLKTLNLTESTFIERLHQIENASKE